MKTRWVALLVGALVLGCPATPSPLEVPVAPPPKAAELPPGSSFYDGLPAETWGVAELDLRAQEVPPGLTQAIAAFGAPAEKCGVHLPGDVERVEVAWFHGFSVLARVHGAITAAKARCLLEAAGAAPLLSGILSEPSPGVVDLAIGRVPSRAQGERSEVVDRFRALPRSTLAFVLAVDGKPVPFQVWFRAEGSRFFAGLRLADEARAREIGDFVESGLAAAKRAGVAGADGVTASCAGGEVSVGFGMDERLVLRSLLESFRIPSASMVPTLLEGDRVFVAKASLAGRASRGEVVAFPLAQGMFIKRVVAVEGDQMRMTKAGALWLNGVAVPTELVDSSYRYTLDGKARTAEVWREEIDGHVYRVLHDPASPPVPLDPSLEQGLTVPPGQIFVLGDNRENAYDSRSMGPIPVSKVLGRAILVWLSQHEGGVDFSRIGRLVE